MQSARFDAMTQALARPRSRRGLLALLAGAFALAAGTLHRDDAAAAKAGSPQDLADICRQAGGIPAPGTDGSLNCVLDNGAEIHCDSSGRCTSHCWPQYGCDCRHADVCHRSSRPHVSPGGPLIVPGNALVLNSTGDRRQAASGDEKSYESRAKRRKRRKRNRRRK